MPKDKPKSVADLRDLLLETIQGVQAGDIDAPKGRAIAELSKAVNQVDRLAFEMMVLAGRTRQQSRISSSPPLALTHAEPDDEDNEETVEEEIEDVEEKEIDDEEEDEPEPPPSRKPNPQSKQPPAKSEWKKQVTLALKKDQPLDLDELYTITRIPTADLFKLLADETTFERDSDRQYWLAK